MPDCECLKGCVFFNDKMANMPSTASLFKKRFCQTDNSNCARYIIFSKIGKEKVPFDLFPSEIEKANKILTQYAQ